AANNSGTSGSGGNGGGGGIGITAGGPGSIHVENFGTIIGGAGGAAGKAGTIANASATVGSDGSGGQGGVAVRLEGTFSRLANAGTISAGADGDGVIRANAVELAGNNNSVELYSTGKFIGNVVATGTSNTFVLTGETDGSFDASRIKSASTDNDAFDGFTYYQKEGVSTWNLTGTAAAPVKWLVTSGRLAGSVASMPGDIVIFNGAAELYQATGTTGTYSGKLSTYISYPEAVSSFIKSGEGELILDQTDPLSINTVEVSGLLKTNTSDIIEIKDSLIINSVGSTLDIGSINFASSGQALVFDLTDAADGSTMLTMINSQLKTSNDTEVRFLLSAKSLEKGDSVVLVDGVDTDSSITDTPVIIGRKVFSLNLAGPQLFANLDNIITYVETTRDLFEQNKVRYNRNLIAGAEYLDSLIEKDLAGSAQMELVESAFDDLHQRGGDDAQFGLQQIFGAYGAYANLALASDADRFRRLLQGRNRSFLNDSLPVGVAAQTAGIASGSGLASPRYGVRDAIPAGRPRIWAGGVGSWGKHDRKDGYSGVK
ncbi:MAG: hypothetical protein LIP23_04330, partial [Planctomycetes bacterium]|nr:hypothetical protein [Planctomycetota bacterium]